MSLTRNDRRVDAASTLASRVNGELEEMLQSTEEAVLEIGNLLVAIRDAGTSSITQLKGSVEKYLGTSTDSTEPSGSLLSTLQQQALLVAQFVTKIQAYLDRQLQNNDVLLSASRSIAKTTHELAQQMSISRTLALNLRIEAARLGSDGNSFSVLSDQVKLFSENVAAANDEIAEQVEEFAKGVPSLSQEAKNIEQFLSAFSEQNHAMEEHVNQMSRCLEQSLVEGTASSEAILKLSQATLSHLQFQDPLSQGLRRAQRQIAKLGQISDSASDSSLLDEVSTATECEDNSQVAKGEVVFF